MIDSADRAPPTAPLIAARVAVLPATTATVPVSHHAVDMPASHTPLLPADSRAMRAAARLDFRVRVMHVLSWLIFFTPHGMVTIIKCYLWLNRPNRLGAPPRTCYFGRMAVLKDWADHAIRLGWSMRFSSLVGSAFAFACFIVTIMSAAMGDEKSSDYFHMAYVAIGFASLFLANALHVGYALYGVRSAAVAFDACARPLITSKLTLISQEQAEVFRQACTQRSEHTRDSTAYTLLRSVCSVPMVLLPMDPCLRARGRRAAPRAASPRRSLRTLLVLLVDDSWACRTCS